MKDEREKIKTRTALGANDADWEMVKKAQKKSGMQMSEYLREAVLKDARIVTAKGGAK